ncbi:MAG TPA: response regulator [bacterium]|nr:response regulator [bacterium]HDP99166.1 response regulator [bacterium]
MSKVLIVDDDPLTLTYCKKILENNKFETETAADAFEANDKARGGNFDFIIVDLVLPGPMNGIDVIQSIRSYSPRVTIVAYSGFSDEDITEKVLHAGANTFLKKPFKPDQLLSALNFKRLKFELQN